jgi:hypothetical protein
MYGLENLDPLVKQHFNLATFSREPLGWLYKILGGGMVDELCKKFWLKSGSNPSNDEFLSYLNATFNPLLNKKLNRQWDYPTFRDMLEHCYAPMILNDPKVPEKLKKEFKEKQQRRSKRRMSL